MIAVVLALTASAAWGAADFLGGFAGRKGGPDATFSITIWTQTLGLVLLAVVVAAGGQLDVTPRDMAIGAFAGVGGGLGVTLLYRGLVVGRMGVVAPITAVGAAGLPVIFGLFAGDVPTALASAGIAIALVAIVLVSWEPRRTTSGTRSRLPAGIWEAVGSGIGFAIVFVALDATAERSGLIPLLPMKAAAVLVVASVATVRRSAYRPPPGTTTHLVAIGVLDVVAITAFLLATRRGLLPIVAVLGSLYPAGTVLLARIVLAERLNRVQIGGIALVLVGISLIAAG